MKLLNIRLHAGVLGLSGIALGAFGAHALKAVLIERGMSEAWEIAVRYHLIHAVAVFSAGIFLSNPNSRRSHPWLARAAYCWSAGVLFFSGSLYGLALGGSRWFGPITPLGGLLFLLGWSFAIVDSLCSRLPEKNDDASA